MGAVQCVFRSEFIDCCDRSKSKKGEKTAEDVNDKQPKSAEKDQSEVDINQKHEEGAEGKQPGNEKPQINVNVQE